MISRWGIGLRHAVIARSAAFCHASGALENNLTCFVASPKREQSGLRRDVILPSNGVGAFHRIRPFDRQKAMLQQILGSQQMNAGARAINLLAFLNLLDASRFYGELPPVNRKQGKVEQHWRTLTTRRDLVVVYFLAALVSSEHRFRQLWQRRLAWLQRPGSKS